MINNTFKIKYILLACLFIVITNNANVGHLDLFYFNDLKTKHMPSNSSNSARLQLTRIGYNWSYFSADGSGQSQNVEAFEVKDSYKPVFYPNPFQIKDNPKLMFAISQIDVNEMKNDRYEVQVFNTRGYKVLTKQFDQSNYIYNTFARSGSTGGHYYVNLLFNENDFKGKLASGGYIFILFRNNKQISTGKFTIKAQ